MTTLSIAWVNSSGTRSRASATRSSNSARVICTATRPLSRRCPRAWSPDEDAQGAGYPSRVIDLRIVRDDPDRVRASQHARGEDSGAVDRLLAADAARRA